MFSVYVLRSRQNSKQYVGFTSKSVQQRLKEHNSGGSPFTRNNRPYELIYFEEYENQDLALKREKYFKTGKGRSFLKRKLQELDFS